MELSMSDIRELLCPRQPSTTSTTPSRQIVIGERGWVWVGDVRREGGDGTWTHPNRVNWNGGRR